MTEKQLSEFESKNIKILFNDGEIVEGNCFYFTKALDNDPEVASISVETNDRRVIEVSQDEIKSIEVLS